MPALTSKMHVLTANKTTFIGLIIDLIRILELDMILDGTKLILLVLLEPLWTIHSINP